MRRERLKRCPAVGLLLAALYNPVWTAGIKNPTDFALGMAAFLALYMWNVTPWLVVILCPVAGGELAILVGGVF